MSYQGCLFSTRDVYAIPGMSKLYQGGLSHTRDVEAILWSPLAYTREVCTVPGRGRLYQKCPNCTREVYAVPGRSTTSMNPPPWVSCCLVPPHIPLHRGQRGLVFPTLQQQAQSRREARRERWGDSYLEPDQRTDNMLA